MVSRRSWRTSANCSPAGASSALTESSSVAPASRARRGTPTVPASGCSGAGPARVKPLPAPTVSTKRSSTSAGGTRKPATSMRDAGGALPMPSAASRVRARASAAPTKRRAQGLRLDVGARLVHRRPQHQARTQDLHLIVDLGFLLRPSRLGRQHARRAVAVDPHQHRRGIRRRRAQHIHGAAGQRQQGGAGHHAPLAQQEAACAPDIERFFRHQRRGRFEARHWGSHGPSIGAPPPRCVRSFDGSAAKSRTAATVRKDKTVHRISRMDGTAPACGPSKSGISPGAMPLPTLAASIRTARPWRRFPS
jgi:hypothetical protein